MANQGYVLESEAVDTEFDNSVKTQQSQKKLYRMFLILGIGSLLPFNSVIVPVDFWATFYQPIFLSLSALTYNAGNWCTMIFMMFFGYKLNQHVLVLCSLTTWLLCLVFIPCVHLIIFDPTTLKTVLTLIPIILCGIANGLYFPTVLDVGSRVSPLNAQAMMAGNGIAGLVPQFLLIIIKLIVTLLNVSKDEYTATLFYQTLSYFVIGASFMGVCFATWFSLVRMGYVQKKTGEDAEPLTKEEDAELIERGEGLPKVSTWSLVKQMIVPILGIFFIFAVTLAIYPVITLATPCNYLARDNKLGSDNGWWAIGVMTTFMVFDYVGRQIPKFKWAQCFSLNACLAIAIGRLVFFALFVMEAIPHYTCDATGCHDGPLIRVDEVTILTMVVFSLSNGWVSSVIMMKFQAVVKDTRAMGLAANIQTFALNSGLFAGGLLSLAVQKIV